MPGLKYSIKKNRIKQGYVKGFQMDENGGLHIPPEASVCGLYLKAIDSAMEDATWGRLSFDVDLSEDVIYYVYVVALNEDSFYRNNIPTKIESFLTNPEESDQAKKEFFKKVKNEAGIAARRIVSQNDVLLYDLKGRYLYVMILTSGEGTGSFRNFVVDRMGDQLMEALPEIYRERDGFLHHYLSVFSTIYNDFQTDIEKLHELLDLDKCPAELLPEYGRWMGLDISNSFLQEDTMRTLVKEAYQLNKMKGTRWCMLRLCEILLGEKVQVLEQNMMQNYIEKNQLADFQKLYGSSPFDVTILTQKVMSETEKSQLIYILNQYKPIRSRLHILTLEQNGNLDDHSYLDMNARIYQSEGGTLDEKQGMDGFIMLTE